MEQYSEYCTLIKQLINEGKIVPQFRNSNALAFRFNETLLGDFISNMNIDKKGFLELLNYEIPEFIIAILNDDKDILLRFKTRDEELSEEDRRSKADEIKKKLSIIEKTLVNRSLIESFIIKKSSKVKVLSELSWEISQKLYDNDEGELNKLKYANIHVHVHDPQKRDPAAFYYLFKDSRGNEGDVTLSLTKEDIEYLILELEQIKKVMSGE